MDEEVRAYILGMLRELAGMAEQAGDGTLAGRIEKAALDSRPKGRQGKRQSGHDGMLAA